MRIDAKSYGKILMSRPAGREAALAMKTLTPPGPGEIVELDFEGILSVGPSWLDEVLTSLRKDFGRERVVCLPSQNVSVVESLKVIN